MRAYCYVTPKGTIVDRIGLEPDVHVSKMSHIETRTAKFDPDFAAAIATIANRQGGTVIASTR